MTDYVELANTRNDGTDGQAHHVHMRPIALASNAVAWTRNSQDLWIRVSHAAWCPLPSAPTPVPDQSFLDFRSSSDWTQTIQLAHGQTMSRSCSAPGSVETCWSRFAEAQADTGRTSSVGSSVWTTGSGSPVRAPESAGLSRGEHRPDCGLVAPLRCGCRTPESARRVAEVSRGRSS